MGDGLVFALAADSENVVKGDPEGFGGHHKVTA
jgi:hypothetical protein